MELIEMRIYIFEDEDVLSLITPDNAHYNT